MVFKQRWHLSLYDSPECFLWTIIDTARYPNEKWTTDVTEFKVPGEKQKLYLSAFMDLYDRSIVAWWNVSNTRRLSLWLLTAQATIDRSYRSMNALR